MTTKKKLEIVTRLIDQAIESQERNEGLRAGLYTRAAWQLLHDVGGSQLAVCMDGILHVLPEVK